MSLHCRLWNPREPFKVRPGISWGRLKQLQPAIYLHLAKWPPNTTQSLFPYRLALTPTERGSRELIRCIEGRPGPHLRSVQHQHQPLREKQTESHPRGEQHRVHFIQSGASDGARCSASLSSSTPELSKLTLEGTNSSLGTREDTFQLHWTALAGRALGLLSSYHHSRGFPAGELNTHVAASRERKRITTV